MADGEHCTEPVGTQSEERAVEISEGEVLPAEEEPDGARLEVASARACTMSDWT